MKKQFNFLFSNKELREFISKNNNFIALIDYNNHGGSNRQPPPGPIQAQPQQQLQQSQKQALGQEQKQAPPRQPQQPQYPQQPQQPQYSQQSQQPQYSQQPQQPQYSQQSQQSQQPQYLQQPQQLQPTTPHQNGAITPHPTQQKQALQQLKIGLIPGPQIPPNTNTNTTYHHHQQLQESELNQQPINKAINLILQAYNNNNINQESKKLFEIIKLLERLLQSEDKLTLQNKLDDIAIEILKIRKKFNNIAIKLKLNVLGQYGIMPNLPNQIQDQTNQMYLYKISLFIYLFESLVIEYTEKNKSNNNLNSKGSTNNLQITNKYMNAIKKILDNIESIIKNENNNSVKSKELDTSVNQLVYI